MARERIREGALVGKEGRTREEWGARGVHERGKGREVLGSWDESRRVGKIEEQWEGTRLLPGRFSSEIAFGQVAVSLQMHRRCIESGRE